MKKKQLTVIIVESDTLIDPLIRGKNWRPITKPRIKVFRLSGKKFKQNPTKEKNILLFKIDQALHDIFDTDRSHKADLYTEEK